VAIMSTERAGVYAIVHVPTGRMYAGSASNISKRWSRHRQELRDGTHRNAHLQATWTRDGADAFAWRLLAITEPGERIALEQRVIDALGLCDPERGFNRAAIAGVSYGGTGRAWTDEQRAAASAAWKRLRPAQPAGSRCPKGHVKDGTYTKRRPNGSVKVLCQDCERQAARERARAARGIPLDWPPGTHFNRRG
jgi:hypothetical protein